MNYKLLGLVAWLVILNCNGMEAPAQGVQQGQTSVEEKPTFEEALTKELSKIPAEELTIYKEFYATKLTIATAVFRKLIEEYSDSAIPSKRQRRLDKEIKLYLEQSNALLYKSIGSFLVSTGTGYYTCKGCKTPEATVGVGITSASFALLALKYGLDWYNLLKPTHASVAQQIKHKMNSSSPDARPSILRKITKIFVPESKENK